MPDIHSTAIVSPRAQLGENVVVEPFAIIEDDVVIGDGTTVMSSARIYGGVRLGNNVRVFPSASIGAEPQDLKFGGEKTELHVGDNTVIREFTSLHRGTGEGGKTRIGSNCLLMAYSHVAHDCIIGDHVILANSVNLAGHVEIEDHVILGGIVPIHQFVRVGRHAMVGGGFRVPKDVPPYILAGGYPLAYAGLNSIGLRRRGFSSDEINAIKQAYQLLFRSGLNTTQALEEIEKSIGGNEHVKRIVAFARASQRGLLPGRALRGSQDL